MESKAEQRVGIRQVSARLWMVSECGADIRKTSKKKAHDLYKKLLEKHQEWDCKDTK